jgi:cytochrome c biogenesis protein CcmG, thiol:disulfide interchange protein DsbE
MMSKTNLVKLTLLFLFLAGALFFALYQGPRRMVGPGDQAPDFILPRLSGGSIALRDFRRQVVVVNFWATWCPPCVEETPGLTKFAEEMRTSGVVVIGVSEDQNLAALERFVTDNHLTFPIARDPDHAVATRYGTFKYPESYIIGGDGQIARKIVGAIDWQNPDLRNEVQNLARRGAGTLP